MVYPFDSSVLNGKSSFKSEYYFFQHALFRNKSLEVDRIDTLSRTDVSKLEQDYDIVLLPQIDATSCMALTGIRDCTIPVVAKGHDPHDMFRRPMLDMMHRLKVDWSFDFYDPESFYEYYPKHFKYATVHMGLEPSLCTNSTPWDERICDKIAISGVIDVNLDLARRLYRRLYAKQHKALLPGFHYKLRGKCNDLPYVVHTRDLQPGQGTDQLNKILSMFRAAISATTSFPTIKYKETPAAGCLTFMEVTERNHGAFLEYEDGKNAVFITESNYKEKFQEYLDAPDDPKWMRIAQAGKTHALENLSNDKGVLMLIEIMRKTLGEA